MPAGFRTVVFSLLVPGPVAFLVPAALASERFEIARLPLGASRGFGALLIATGIALYVWAAREFVRAGGTPAPFDPPRRLVTRGPFAHSRNPIYASVLFVLGGQALLRESATVGVYALALAIGFHLRVVRWEEPRLERAFGEAFRRYCRQVPRWLPASPRRWSVSSLRDLRSR